MNLLNINIKDKHSISSIFLSLIFLFPIMPNAIQSISLIAFLAISGILYYKTFLLRIKDKRIWAKYGILTGFFWFSILSFFWSTDKFFFFTEIRPALAIAFLPFVILFFHPPLKASSKRRSILFFLIALIIYSIIWFFHHIEGISLYQEILAKESPIRDESFFDRINFLIHKPYKLYVSGLSERGYDLLGGTYFFSHYSFVSSYYLFGMVLSFFMLKESRNRATKIISFLALLLSVSFVVYLQSKINILVLLLIITSYFLYSQKLRWLFIIAFAVFVFTNLTTLENKYMDLKEWSFYAYENKSVDDKTILDFKRSKIYTCTIPKIKENILFGIGQGDAQGYLNKCLENYSLDGVAPIKEYNTHSQYLNYFLVGGIFNAILFIGIFIYLVMLGFKQRNKLLFYFCLIIFANCLFENYLSRIYGVLFFTLFLTLLPNWKLEKSRTNTN